MDMGQHTTFSVQSLTLCCSTEKAEWTGAVYAEVRVEGSGVRAQKANTLVSCAELFPHAVIPSCCGGHISHAENYYLGSFVWREDS